MNNIPNQKTHLTCLILHAHYKFQHEPVPGLAQFGCSSLAVPSHMTAKTTIKHIGLVPLISNGSMILTHMCKVFPMHLLCQSPHSLSFKTLYDHIYCANLNYVIMLIVNLHTVHYCLILKLKIDCNTQSCLLLTLNIIVLYNHTIIKIQDNHTIVKIIMPLSR